MSANNPEPMDSYLNAYPGAPVLSSEGLGWHGINVTFDHFLPFERDTFCYREYLVWLNLGRRAALLAHSMGRHSFQGRIGKGECFVVPAGQPIKWELKTEADALSFLLQPAFVREVAESIGSNPDKTELRYRIPVRDRDIEAIGRFMLRELRSGGLGGRMLAESLANILVVHLLRSQSDRPPSEVEQLQGLSERCRKQVVDYVQEKLCDSSLSLADLARIAGVSPYHFAREFKKSMGMPPHQYIIQQRVELAQRLLREGSETVAAIAVSVGFSDQSHLCQHFKRTIGVTPTEFRGSTREQQERPNNSEQDHPIGPGSHAL
jgi:AraC family transcriptional regulator